MAETLRVRGLDVTLIEHGSQVVKVLDEDMSSIRADVLTANGVEILFGKETERLVGAEQVERIRLSEGDEVPADMVGVGAWPNVRPAKQAGIALGESGAIAVDNAQRTSEFHVYTAGDCAEALHVVLDRSIYIPLGTTANKQGRVAGDNVVGDRSAASRGRRSASSSRAPSRGPASRRPKRGGTHLLQSPRRSRNTHAPQTHVKRTFDERTRRLLGGQLVGDATVAKRIDVVVTALHAQMTIDAFSQLDLSYAPPFAPVWDPLLVAPNGPRR